MALTTQAQQNRFRHMVELHDAVPAGTLHGSSAEDVVRVLFSAKLLHQRTRNLNMIIAVSSENAGKMDP